MTVALVVAVLWGVVVVALWWRERCRHRVTEQALVETHKGWRSERRRADAADASLQAHAEALQARDATEECVHAALAKVWHHVTPETPEEGAAAAMLRAFCPELPVPEAPRSLVEEVVEGLVDEMADASLTRDMYALHEEVGCGTFQHLADAGPSWPQCECLRFNPPGAESCARCGATPPKPREHVAKVHARIAPTPTPNVTPLKEDES